MEGLIPEVVAQIKQLGFDAERYEGVRPADAVHRIEITANWRWDMAMYLFYFQATLMDNSAVLGTAEYDARTGGANMGKFGTTAEKIRPLISELLRNATKPGETASIGSK